MTKEQEKAINNLKQYIEEDEIYNSERENLSDFDKFCINHCIDIETVLELIKIQQKQIEFYKNGLEREIESNRENILEIIKQDKIIDEMLVDVLAYGFDFIDFGRSTGDFKEDKEKLRKYYQKKVENKNE